MSVGDDEDDEGEDPDVEDGGEDRLIDYLTSSWRLSANSRVYVRIS
jgi:hypothetical protein